MVIAGEKMRVVANTVLPLLFLLSAFSVGFPMVIMSHFRIESFDLNLKKMF
jgi:hypothetical protein